MKKQLKQIFASLIPVAFAAPSLGVPRPEQAKITDIGILVSSSINIVIIIAGILVFALLVWGGIQWMTSGGDKTKTEEAKSQITNALIGFAIVAASWAVWKIVIYFFGVDIDLA